MGQQRQVSLQVPATATFSSPLYSGNGRIIWHAFKESTGAATAQYSIYDGSGTSGPLLMPVSLLAAESTRDSFLPHGLDFKNGLFISVSSGTVIGNIVIVPERDWDEFIRPQLVVNIPIDEIASLVGQQ